MANDFKFGNKLIWQKESYVPYDGNCTLIVDGDSNTQKFSVKVMKNGVDVTSSLDHYTDFSYIVNDVLPSYRITNQVVSGTNEITISDLINKYKETEQVTDSRYDDTKGEFSYAGCRVYSKAGGSFLNTGSVATLHNITIPYTLTEDYSTNDLWIVVSQNVDNTPVEIKTLQVATTFVGNGSTSIYVFHESGLLVYKYDSNWYTPSFTQKTISGQTYNYLTIDLTALSSGTFKLKRFEKYYIKIKHASNNDNHYYYRNGGILGIVGYVTGNINLPSSTYNLNSLTYEWTKSSEPDMLSVNTLNHYAKYAGASNKFESNKIYKCKLAFNYGGEITENDYWMLNAVDGQVGYYSGPASTLGITGAFVKSGAPIGVTVADTPSTIYTENDSSKIFKFTGNTTANIFVQNRFYSCKKPLISSNGFKGEITTAPSYTDVSVGDIYLVLNGINYGHYSSHYAEPGIWKVTSVDLSGEDYMMTKENTTNYIVDETDNMKAKLLSFNRDTYYEEMYGTDLSNLTINTDHKHEILMGA